MKRFPLTPEQTQRLLRVCPTPFYLYDEHGIRASARALNTAFAWAQFKEHFSIKAMPNEHVVRLLREEGCGADCGSLPELVIAERAGLRGEEIVLSSNDTSVEEFAKARELGAIINLDAHEHIEFLERHGGLPGTLCLRYNPGELLAGGPIIGESLQSKFGMTREQVIDGLLTARKRGVRHLGVHMMSVTNERDHEKFVAAAHALFDLARELLEQHGIALEFVNIGGGMGIPYRERDAPIDLKALGDGIRRAYETLPAPLRGMRVLAEEGRFVTGPHGYLVARVRHIKHSYKTYVGLDTSITDLIRIPMYGAHHHVSVLGKEHAPIAQTYDVTGSLCENSDKFATDRPLPHVEVGDIVVIHDAGAHSQAMGLDYNGRLRSKEILLRPDGSVVQIRRAQAVEDYVARITYEQIGVKF
jgi:diaminopimelate decarboxylase